MAMYFNIVPDRTEKFPQCDRHSFHKIDTLAIQACSLTQSYNIYCKYCQRCGKASQKNNKFCANGNQRILTSDTRCLPLSSGVANP